MRRKALTVGTIWLLLVALPGLCAWGSGAGVVWVDPDFDSSTIGWGVTHFAEIQEAVNSVAEGGEVNVAAGTYGDQELVINKSLFLKGPNYDICPNSESRADEAIIPNGMELRANDVTIRGFTVEGEGIQSSGNDSIRIAYNIVANVEAVAMNAIKLYYSEDSSITNNRIVLGHVDNRSIGTLDITNVDISHNYMEQIEGSDQALSLSASGTDRYIKDVTVTHNIIKNAGHPDAPDRGGIRIRWGEGSTADDMRVENLSITNNTLEDNHTGLAIRDIAHEDHDTADHDTDQDTAYWSNVTIENNTFRNNTIGVYHGGQGELHFDNNTFQDNEFENNDIQVKEDETIADLDLEAVLANNDFDPTSVVMGNMIVPKASVSIRNTTQSTYHATIQSAIDEAEDDDIILVEAGTYEEFVHIDRPLTLRGPFYGTPGNEATRGDSGEAVIRPPTDASRVAPDETVYLVRISSENVVIDGFTVTDEEDGDGKFAATVGIHSKEGELECLNNRINNLPKFGIQVARPAKEATDWLDKSVADDGAIENVLIRGNLVTETALVDDKPTWGYGIQLSGTVAQVVDNVVLDSRVALAIQPYNQPDVELTADGLVQGNRFESYRIGLFFHAGGISGHYAVSGNWLFDDNEFALAEIHPDEGEIEYWAAHTRASKFYFGKSIEFRDNTFDTTNQEDYNSAWSKVRGLTFRNDLGAHDSDDLGFVYTGNAFAGSGGEIYVQLKDAENPSNPPLEIALADVLTNNTFDRAVVVRGSDIKVPVIFSSIQDAIDQAETEDTVEVSGGTYIEQLVIEESLTVAAVENSSPVIRAPAAADRITQSISPDSDRTFDPIVFIDGGEGTIDVTVQGLEIDGNDDPGSDNFVGILARNIDPGLITDNDLHSLMGSQETLGISVYGEASNVTVSENTVTGFSRNAITVVDASVANVAGNTVIGRGYVGQGYWAQNGIQLWKVEQGNVSENTLSDIGWIWPGEGASWAATGIVIIDCNGATVVHNNTLTNVMVGIWALDSSFEATENTVEMLDSGDLAYTGGIWGNPKGRPGVTVSAFDVELDERDPGDTVLGLTTLTFVFEDNTVVGDNAPSYGGLAVLPADGFHVDATATGNTIKNWEIGFEVWGSGSFSALVSQNHLEGNEYGIDNVTDTTVDARNNYWGHISGPSGGVNDPESGRKATGQGDSVSENVRFDPWLSAPDGEPFTPKSATLSFSAGWNLISTPFVPLDAAPSEVFADIDPLVIYEWVDGEYKVPDHIEPGRGYWVWLIGDTTVTTEGFAWDQDYEVQLGEAGWQLLSTPTVDVYWGYVEFRLGEETKDFEEAVKDEWITPIAYRRDVDVGEYAEFGKSGAIQPWFGHWIRTLKDDVVAILPVEEALTSPPPAPVPTSSATVLARMAEAKNMAPPPPPTLPLNPDTLEVTASPNPVTTEQAATFAVRGPLAGFVEAVRVQVTDLSGRTLFRTEEQGAGVRWNLVDPQGQPVANGVYLCIIEVKAGGSWIHTPVQKLLIVR